MNYDLSKIYCNFTKCPPGKNLVDFFAELQPFPEFSKCDDNRIKIAILSGDTDSPFTRIKDRDIMIRSIFEYLNIPIVSKEDKAFYDDVVLYRDDLTVFAWLRYLQILNETDFTNWLLIKRDYDFFLKKSHDKQMEGESDDKYLAKRNKIRNTLKELGEEQRNIEAKLFPDSKAAREAAIAEARSKIRLYAESYATEYTHI